MMVRGQRDLTFSAATGCDLYFENVIGAQLAVAISC